MLVEVGKCSAAVQQAVKRDGMESMFLRVHVGDFNATVDSVGPVSGDIATATNGDVIVTARWTREGVEQRGSFIVKLGELVQSVLGIIDTGAAEECHPATARDSAPWAKNKARGRRRAAAKS